MKARPRTETVRISPSEARLVLEALARLEVQRPEVQRPEDIEALAERLAPIASS